MVIFLFWWSFLGFWGHIHFWNTNYFWSRLNFWCCINLLGSLQFWGCPHFLGRSHLWGCLHFWASLHFGGCLHVLGRDTSFLACFWHTKKYLQEVLSLKVGKCIHFLNNMWFKDFFSLKNQSITSAWYYHVCVILSRLCDSLNVTDAQVSRRRNSITKTWYSDFLRKKLF